MVSYIGFCDVQTTSVYNRKIRGRNTCFDEISYTSTKLPMKAMKKWYDIGTLWTSVIRFEMCISINKLYINEGGNLVYLLVVERKQMKLK